MHLRAAVLVSVGGLLLSSAVGCSSTAAQLKTTDPRAEEPPRRPPAGAVEPATRLPDASPTADARSALAVLASPRELAQVRETVGRLFSALVNELPGELDPLLTEQAWLDTPTGRTPARNTLRARFAQLDFSPLRGVMLYREPELEIYRASDAQALADVRAVPDDLGADEVFVRVHVSVSHAGKVRLFSDRVALTLRSEPSGFRVSTIAEDTPVP